MLWQALGLGLGYNATLVTIGAALLGGAAGGCGTFLTLRKRALVSDAISHATLPGVALAFIAASLLGFDGRSLPVLLAGSALSALAGLLCVQWLTNRTRLSEDAAIGAVLSVFFGAGVVLLTVIQSMSATGQAGLEGFLLGATAGMLQSEALLIAIGGGLALLALLILRRPLTLVAFDEEFATSLGINVRHMDLAAMALVMAVTVIGLKVVGLILIVALLIIPPVTARFWSEQSHRVVLLASVFGAISGYLGASLSAAYSGLPTGALIVLVAAGLFVISILLSPRRGVLAAMLSHMKFRDAVHLRQGILALANGQPVFEPLTLRILKRNNLIRPDGVLTDEGRAAAARAVLDEARWQHIRHRSEYEVALSQYDGLGPIERVLTQDQLAEIDRQIGGPREATL